MENIVRKGAIACKKQFLSFSHNVLYPIWYLFSILMHLKMLSAICFNLDRSKILSSGNGLKGSDLAKKIFLVNNILLFFCCIFYSSKRQFP